MANPYEGIAAQILAAYQNQANTLQGYSQGFSGNLQSLANADAQSAMALLEQMGAPDSQVQQVGDQAGGPVGDTLYGQTGYLPAAALGEQGNAYAAYAATLPGLLQAELQQNAQYFAATHPPPTYSSGGSSGGSSSDGGDSGGLTPSQQLAIEKFQYDQEQDAMKWDFEMMKWEHELALDKQKAKADAAATKLLMKRYGLDASNTKADNARYAKAAKESARHNRVGERQAQERINQNWARMNQPGGGGGNNAAASSYRKGLYAEIVAAGERIRPSSSGSPDSWGTTTGGGSKKVPYGQAFRQVMSAVRTKYAKPNGKWSYGLTNVQVRKKINGYLKAQTWVAKHKKPAVKKLPKKKRPGAPGMH